MALHVPKAPGFAQMLKEGAKVRKGGRGSVVESRHRAAAVVAKEKGLLTGRACFHDTAVGGREDSRKGGVLGRARPRRPAGISVLYRPLEGSRGQRRRVGDEAAGFAFYISRFIAGQA